MLVIHYPPSTRSKENWLWACGEWCPSKRQLDDTYRLSRFLFIPQKPTTFYELLYPILYRVKFTSYSPLTLR